MSKKAIVFGAGNIGRGFLAEILQKDNFTFTFVDVNKEVVDKLNSTNQYKINYLSTNNHYLIKDSFNAIAIGDPALLDAIKDADLILTAIGVKNLFKLNPVVAPALKSYSTKKTIMACENAVRGTSQWKETLKEHVNLDNDNIQLIDAVVDRIVPNQDQASVDVGVENYYSIIGDKKQIKFDPCIKTVDFHDGFESYVERKLYLVNALHAYIAWLGISNNIKVIHEVLANKELFKKSQGLAHELISILNHKRGLKIESLTEYGYTSLDRFKNKDLNDSCLRVGSGVLRKIGKGSRITDPLAYALKNNLSNNFLQDALKLGLTIKNPNDPEVKQRDQILSKGFKQGVEEITCLKLEDTFYDD